ncbi:hypothetical protein P4O66_017940 [Electrophorus voltai]|uniref:Reverse transcriptase domain-containing protein n=1 Tax=Electrophorus voltai TaxID=2609070 RepID=A0AAD9DMF5_9TELE|nr:hypothetical protein P4O66_017940 [Electrophorus voltai]
MDESATKHLLGSKKKVKIHPNTVTVKYSTDLPKPDDNGYEDAPSFDDFRSFVDETSDRKWLTESKQIKDIFAAVEGQSKPSGGQKGKGVGGQLQRFGEASVFTSQLTMAALFGAALAHGCVAFITQLASDRSRVPSLELLFIRSVIQVLLVVAVIYYQEAPFGLSVFYRLQIFFYGVCNVISITYEIIQLLTSSDLTTCPLDPIPSALFQTIARDLLPFISVIINNSLSSGYVPTAFKTARVVPILKKATLDSSSVTNYRPNQLHDPNQSGYKLAHSTETALIAVTEKLHAAKAAKQSTVLILLDLSEAFDTVNHNILLSVLSGLGVTGSVWRCFQSYLDGRSYQAVMKLILGRVLQPESVIVCPLSLISNWLDQFEQHVWDDVNLKVYLYWGPQWLLKGDTGSPSELRDRLISKITVVMSFGSDDRVVQRIQTYGTLITYCAHVFCRPCICEVISSGQVDALMSNLLKLHSEYSTIKCLVVSQFKFLTLLSASVVGSPFKPNIYAIDKA